MTEIVALSGSLRRKSYNTALLRAAAELAPDESRVAVETLEGIPLYNADDEDADGLPERVVELKERIASADGLLIATPEYNHSMPGVLKNGIDWLTRPPKEIGTVFGGRPVALTGATPGGGGTSASQTAWLPVLRTLGLRLWSEGRLYVARAHDVFNDDGELDDDDIRDRTRSFMRGFVDFIQECGG